MPYYYRSWNVALGEPAVKSGRKLRKTPPGEQPPEETPPPPAHPVGPVDANTLAQIREAIKTHVDDLKATKCATPIKESDTFLNYLIQKDLAIFEGKYSSIYSCFNHQSLEMPLVCRIYQPTAMISGENDLFLKVLRKLGASNPNIIATVDIFSDECRRIYVMQEYANRGNAYDFLKSSIGQNFVTEHVVHGWALDIFQAMDFIGGQGIAHRSIQPKHFMLCTTPDGGGVMAKLGSFRDAVIYYDVVSNDIIDQPCKPVAKRQYYAFHAPEVFGEQGEFYHPVEADIWSFGATLLFLAGRTFAFNIQSPEKNLDETIKANIANTKLSEDAKYCFYGMMRCNTELRTPFEALLNDPWMQNKSA